MAHPNPIAYNDPLNSNSIGYVDSNNHPMSIQPSAPPLCDPSHPTYPALSYTPPPQPPPETFAFNLAIDSVAVSKEVAKKALEIYVSQTCCWGSGPAKKCVITSNQSHSSFSCELKTFIEYRTTSNIERPYNREPLTMRGNGPILKPWYIT